MWVNTEEFRREAKSFLKNGYYCKAPTGSAEWRRYWREQQERCRHGYEVGGQRITGPYYDFLNFHQIRLTPDKALREVLKDGEKSSGRMVGKKTVTFPDFWDGHAYYHEELEDARNSGENLAVAKARRKGFSYLNAALVNNKVQHHPNFHALIGAYQEDFLTSQNRILDMLNSYISFYNANTAWGKHRDFVDQKMEKEFSYKEYLGGKSVKRGYKSSITGQTFYHSAEQSIGSDNDLAVLEEAGKWPNLLKVIKFLESTLTDGDVVTGQMIVFGAVGTGDSGTPFEEIFYNGDAYRFRKYEHSFDDKYTGKSIGFFFPNFWNKIGYMDNKGNSHVDTAKDSDLTERARVRKTSSDTMYKDFISQRCHTPEEAFIVSDSSIFPVDDLKERERELMTNKRLRNLGIPGFMHRDNEGNAKFKVDYDKRPILEYPPKPKGSDSGCVVIYEPPQQGKGFKFSHPYLIAHDPYQHDSGSSIGSTLVYKRRVPGQSVGDTIVATYHARPTSLDDYNYQLFALADYYGAKIGFENNVGTVVSYARKKRKLHKLARQFSILDKQLKGGSRAYGMHVGTREKMDGEGYIKDWLMEERAFDEKTGKSIMTLHHIYDLGLVRELIKYNRDGNFDRISALNILMYFLHEITSIEGDSVGASDVYEDYEFFKD